MKDQAPTHGSASVFSLFRNRFVQAIMMAGLFMHLGIWIRNFAILLYVKEMTNDDAVAVSFVSVAEYAPIFIFSFIGGAFADRWRPKLTMIWCDLLSALSVFAVLLSIMLGSWQAVFFTTLISAILSQFSQPSSMKLFKQHVPEEMLQAGMSIFQTMGALFMVLGPAIGTIVFLEYGITTSLILTGIAFLASAIALLRLPSDHKEQESEQVKGQIKSPSNGIRQELAAGFRYVQNHKLLKLLGGCFAFSGLAIGLIQPMGIFLVTERLQLDESYLSVLLMVNGVAMLIGGGLTLVLSRRFKPQHLLALGIIVSSMGVLICGLSTQLWLTILGQFMSGLVMPCIQIGIHTLLLKNTESNFIGRVNGILNPLFIGSMVITMSLAGVLKNATSLVLLYESAAVIFLLATLFLIPILRIRGSSEAGAAEVKPLVQAE